METAQEIGLSCMALPISEIKGNAFSLTQDTQAIQVQAAWARNVQSCRSSGGNNLRKEMLNIACSPYNKPILLLTAGTEVFF
jgi:hypothetical protein